MNELEIKIVIAAVGFCFAILGFFIRSIFDMMLAGFKEKRRVAVSKRIERLSRQLSKFYWPIYLRLQKDEVVFRLMFDKNENYSDVSDIKFRRSIKLSEKIGEDIESNFILPNHYEIVNIIEKNMHYCEFDDQFEKILLKYIRHVAIYKALRSSGEIKKTPDNFGELWPNDFIKIIRNHTHKLQSEYDSLLSI